MKLKWIGEFVLFVSVVLVQVLLLNRILMVGMAVPIVYIYFVLKLNAGRNPYFVILSSFLLGFIIDMFMNTPGINAAATTIVGTCRQGIFYLFYDRDTHEDYVPSIHTDSFSFVKYTIFMVVLHLLLLFFIESFTFFNWEVTLKRTLTSSFVSVLLIIVVDSLIKKTKPGEQSK
ncbi:MAG: rod shape-determining protein MreD [Fermentimonas sp.]|jgi:rod shape-determining protein MreD